MCDPALLIDKSWFIVVSPLNIVVRLIASLDFVVTDPEPGSSPGLCTIETKILFRCDGDRRLDAIGSTFKV